MKMKRIFFLCFVLLLLLNNCGFEQGKFFIGSLYTHNYSFNSPNIISPYTMEGTIDIYTDRGIGKETASEWAMVEPKWDKNILYSIEFKPDGKTWTEQSTVFTATKVSEGVGNHQARYRYTLNSGYCLKINLSEFVKQEYINEYSAFHSKVTLKGSGGPQKELTTSIDIINLVDGTLRILNTNFNYRKIQVKVFDRVSEELIKRTLINYDLSFTGNQNESMELRNECDNIFRSSFPQLPQNVDKPSHYSRESIISKIIEKIIPPSSLETFNRSGMQKTFAKGSSLEFYIFENQLSPSYEIKMFIKIQAEGYKTYEQTVDFPNNTTNVDIFLNPANSYYKKSSKKQIKLY